MTDEPPGLEIWKKHASELDRVHSVVYTLSEPRPVSFIASEAHVTELTTEKHLERLIDEGAVQKLQKDGNDYYSINVDHSTQQTVQELLSENDPESLKQMHEDILGRIELWQREYDADSPAELRDQVEENSATADRELSHVIRDWELMLYRLRLVERAIEKV